MKATGHGRDFPQVLAGSSDDTIRDVGRARAAHIRSPMPSESTVPSPESELVMISGISSTSSLTGTRSSSDTTAIEKQIKELQQQIEKLNQSKLDEKTKAQLIAQLENQIQMLEMQLQQKANQQTQTTQTSAQEGSSNNALDVLA